MSNGRRLVRRIHINEKTYPVEKRLKKTYFFQTHINEKTHPVEETAEENGFFRKRIPLWKTAEENGALLRKRELVIRGGLANAGVLAIEHADFDGIERLTLVTGGEIASTFDNPESVKLGQCKLIEEIMIGEDKLIHFSGVALGQTCIIVLRGVSPHMLDEGERSLGTIYSLWLLFRFWED